jgi:predicted Rossmann fold nucleotide-binding protein DprA/Smf involved in DNA uptake
LLTERWESSGIWVIGLGDSTYPSRLKSYLGQSAPPLLFGVGLQELLQQGGVAIVGSRDASEENLEFARQLGRACAASRIPVISGAARGVDIQSMMAAVDSGGASIGVLAEGLGRTAIASKFHDGITDGRLVLLSPFDPESRWFPYTAMERNKLVYGLVDCAVVVSSGDNDGGTWAGAIEGLNKRSKVPVYVKASGSVPLGNSHLLQKGALPLPEDVLKNIELLFKDPPTSVSMFDSPVSAEGSSPNGSIDELQSDDVKDSILATSGTIEEDGAERIPPCDDSAPTSSMVSTDALAACDAYSAVEPLLLDILKEPLEEKTIAEKLGLIPAQAKTWLKRALNEKSVRKMSKSKPVRYISAAKSSNLFGA